MAKKPITNLTQALQCARKLRSGKSCTQAEMKATIALMFSAYEAGKRTKRELRDRIDFLKDMLNRK